MKSRVTIAFLGLLAFALCGAPYAHADQQEELKKRFAQRLPALNRLKAAGKVGETSEGYVEAVKDTQLDDAARKLVNAENRDRKILYELIAKETGSSVAHVARNNAARNWRKAKPGEWFKKGNRWVQKK